MRGAFALADLGAHRRPRRRQDRLHAGDRRRGRSGANATIALCAPTGRAARRLEEATGHEAQTIHRMLEWMPGREPAFRPGHPLPVDLVIVDESSMLNLRLMRGAARRARRVDPRRLRRRRRPAAADRRRQALRGPDRLRRRAGGAADPDLPPGGALDDHHRRPRDQPGPAAPPGARAEDQEHDFFFIERPTPERALETVVEVVAERAPEPLRRRPDPRRAGAGADVQGGGRDRRPQRAPAGASSTRTASRRWAAASGSATA